MWEVQVQISYQYSDNKHYNNVCSISREAQIMQTIPKMMFIFTVTAFDDLNPQQCTSAY